MRWAPPDSRSTSSRWVKCGLTAFPGMPRDGYLVLCHLRSLHVDVSRGKPGIGLLRSRVRSRSDTTRLDQYHTSKLAQSPLATRFERQSQEDPCAASAGWY